MVLAAFRLSFEGDITLRILHLSVHAVRVLGEAVGEATECVYVAHMLTIMCQFPQGN